MTLRYDPNGRPAGLDWDTLAASCPQDPDVWVKPKPEQPDEPQETRVVSASTGRRTPEAVADEIVRLYTEEDLSAAAIQGRTGIGRATVYKILRRRGIEPRTQGGKVRVAA